MKTIGALIALSLLTGCYETGYEYKEREKLEQRIKALEKRADECREQTPRPKGGLDGAP